MELANIEKLLEKYLNAETNLQEENTLRDYFTSNEVAPYLEEYGMLFGYFKENQSEIYTKTIKLKPENYRKKNVKWLSVAASLALLVSVYAGFEIYEKYERKKQFDQVKEALLKVAYNLNRGNDALYSVSNSFNKGANAVTKLNIYDNTLKKVIKTVNY